MNTYTSNSANLHDLPSEIFLYHIFEYIERDIYQALRCTCSVFRNLCSRFSILEREKHQLSQIRNNFDEEREKFLKRREILGKEKLKELDDKFEEILRKQDDYPTDSSTRELREVYNLGGSGFNIPFKDYDCPSYFSTIVKRMLMKCQYCDIDKCLIEYENILIQLTAGVSIKHKTNISGIYSDSSENVEQFYCRLYATSVMSYISGTYACSKEIDENEYEEYFRVVLKSLQCCGNAGMKINGIRFLEFLGKFRKYRSLRSTSSLDHKIIKIKRKLAILLAKFFVRNGCDPFGIVKTERNIFVKKLGRILYGHEINVNPIWRTFETDLSFLIPVMMNPWLMSENEKKVFNESTRLHFEGTDFYKPNTRLELSKNMKRFRQLVSFDWFRQRNQFLLFELVRRKERKIIEFWMNKSMEDEEEKKQVLRITDSEGNSLLHTICSVRGKTERIVEFLVRTVKIDIDSQNDLLETPLMKTMKINHWKVAKILIDSGASIDYIDKHNESTRDILLKNEWLSKKIGKLKNKE